MNLVFKFKYQPASHKLTDITYCNKNNYNYNNNENYNNNNN